MVQFAIKRHTQSTPVRHESLDKLFSSQRLINNMYLFTVIDKVALVVTNDDSESAQ